MCTVRFGSKKEQEDICVMLNIKECSTLLFHYLAPKIQRHNMSSIRSTLLVIMLALVVFDNCKAFYRPMPILIDKTLNKILLDQLDQRFGTPSTTAEPTTTILATTMTTKRTSRRPFITFKPRICHLKSHHHHIKDCTIDEWSKFLQYAFKQKILWESCCIEKNLK